MLPNTTFQQSYNQWETPDSNSRGTFEKKIRIEIWGLLLCEIILFEHPRVVHDTVGNRRDLSPSGRSLPVGNNAPSLLVRRLKLRTGLTLYSTFWSYHMVGDMVVSVEFIQCSKTRSLSCVFMKNVSAIHQDKTYERDTLGTILGY